MVTYKSREGSAFCKNKNAIPVCDNVTQARKKRGKLCVTEQEKQV